MHYIIDGYNVIKKTLFLDHRKLRHARDALLKFIDICRPQGSHNNKITVVFDGRDGFFNFKHSCESNVIFTKNESADDCIKSLVDKATNSKTIRIVSDDKDIIFYCRCRGADIISVRDFIEKGCRKLNESKNKAEDFSELSINERKKINEELRKVWLE